MISQNKQETKLKLDSIDKEIINILQTNFPLVVCPYENIAKQLNITEQEVINRIIKLKDNKVIRRIAPILNIDYFGGYSTLVALKVQNKDIERVSKIINEYVEVSHNYIRSYDLNMWFTLSTVNEQKALVILDEIKNKLNCELFSFPTSKKFKINVNFKV